MPPKYKVEDLRSVNHALDVLISLLDDAHAEDCDLSTIDDDVEEASCNCGLAELEEAVGNVEDKLGEVYQGQ